QAVVNPMNSICAIWEALTQKSFCVIGFGHDKRGCVNQLVQTDLKISRRENVVGVRGKAETDREKSADPESSAGSHSGEVRVHMANPNFLQAQSNITSLIKAKKMPAAPPLIESSDNLYGEFSLFRSPVNVIQQFLLFGQIMHAVNDAFV